MKIAANEKLRNKSVLITGASKGVGRAIAELLSNYGMKLGLLARSEDLLKQAAEEVEVNGSKALILPADLTKREEIEAAVRQFRQEFGTPDFLINNAGLGWRSFWNEISLEKELEMIRVNFLSPLILIRLILPEMLKRNEGRIININSISGLYASPYMGAYCASKAAQLAYSTSLAYELEKTNVKISSIFSGAIDTDFHKNYRGFQKKGRVLSPKKMAEHVLSIMGNPRERLFLASLAESVVIKITNLNPQFFRGIIEAKNLPPLD